MFNRTRDKASPLAARGATVASSPSELLASAACCITVVSDDAALEAVVLGAGGILSGARAGSTLVDMSTVSPEASAEVATAAADAGVAYLRAPVSGNPTVVRSGNLTIIVSGPTQPFEELRPVLEAVGPRVSLVGAGEEARIVKLALQVMIGGTAELMSEALLLGEAGGVDARTLLEVMGSSAVGSPFVKYKTEPLLAGDYSATFTTAMMRKDVELVLDFGNARGARLPFTEALAGILDDTLAAGYSDADLMAVYLRLKERSSAAGSDPGV